ncbi:hypothetical protein Vi05172_g3869 [Venturia inaequalis]|nr:hypothetical protein Vi05172_g3869 [Venturia inaequalis]
MSLPSPVPPRSGSLQLVSNTQNTTHHRNLSWNQIKSMDSIFSTPEETTEDRPTRRVGFLDLPGEIRNQIYSLIFAPAAPGLCLFPSVERFNSFAFVSNCSQIHKEASMFAFSLCYTATNRWHRHDLVQMSQICNRLPSMLSARIHSLELQMQWRLPHKNETTGTYDFFDGFMDWTRWIWDCVELFSGVKKLKIAHTWRGNIDGLSCLKHCLENDVYGPAGVRAPNPETRKWDVRHVTAGPNNRVMKLLLRGLDERHGRVVEIRCVAVSKEELIRYRERSYGWLGTPG